LKWVYFIRSLTDDHYEDHSKCSSARLIYNRYNKMQLSNVGCYMWAGRAQSLWWLATSWSERGSNPAGERDFNALFQSGYGAHPTSYTVGTLSFPGIKRPGHGIDHPTPPSAEVKERVELYLYIPSGF
jgi:hypothetical protein